MVSEKYLKSMQERMMKMQNKMSELEMKKQNNCRPGTHDLIRRRA
jgi:hypothetical protein